MIKKIIRNLILGLPNDPMESFVRKLIHSEVYPGSIHQCPKCEGRLYFYLTILKQRRPPMAAAQAWCEDCQTAIAVDGIVPPPFWAEEATQIWDEKLKNVK